MRRMILMKHAKRPEQGYANAKLWAANKDRRVEAFKQGAATPCC